MKEQSPLVARLLLLLYIVCCTSPTWRRPIVAESFVLRGGPMIAQLEEALHDDDDVIQLGDEEDVNKDFVDQLSPFDIQRMTDDVSYQSPIGYENAFNRQSEEDLGIDDEDSDVNHVINSDDENNGDFEDLTSDQQPEGVKTTLNKSELHELFDLVKSNDDQIKSPSVNQATADETSAASLVEKKAELSKNEVEHLFEKAVESEIIDATRPVQPVVIATDNNSSSSAGDRLVIVPTVEVTTIEELVKNKDGVQGKEVTLEEKFFPQTNQKTTNEWMIELTRPEVDLSVPSTAMMRASARRGKRKSKRSLPLTEDNESDLLSERVAKSQAVELLKTYIRLQEEENLHLTEALNLATRGQTEKSDRYVGREIQHLKQAVGDEHAIERIRDLIRDQEGYGNTNDDDDDDDDSIDNGGSQSLLLDDVSDDVVDDIDDVSNDEDFDVEGDLPDEEVVGFATKRSDGSQFYDEEENIQVPPLLTFDAGDQDDGEEDELEKERINEYLENDALLRSKLQQYIIQRELENSREKAALDDDREDEDWILTDEPAYRPSYRDSVRLNPFTREFDDIYQFRRNRRGPTVNQYDFDPRNIDDIDEMASARQETVDADTLENILHANPIANTIANDDTEFFEQLIETGVCPAVQELTDNCLVARERGLILDDEALQLCNRHQLCYSCGAEFDLTPETCDRGYLSEAERLCSASTSDGQLSRCKAEAAGLYVIMLDGHRYYTTEGPGYSVPPVCQRRCTYDFIVGSTNRPLLYVSRR